MELDHAYVDSVLVVAGGDPWSGPLPRFGSSITQVIAADSGVDLAAQLGLPVDVVIGDLDSASAEALEEAERSGARIERHPRDKDVTDLELALDLAAAEGATNIVVVGGAGGRMSHFLGNAALIASPKYAAARVKWLLPGAEVYVATGRHEVTIEGTPGDLVSLIPITGDATGVTTNGLRWPLEGDTLTVSETRGMSNEMAANQSDVAVESGILLVVHERVTS